MKEIYIHNEQFHHDENNPFYVLELMFSQENYPMLLERTQIHWHSEIEICYCQYSGNIHHIDGKEYRSEPGKVLIVNSGSIHFFDMVPYTKKEETLNAIILIVKKEYLEKWIPGFSDCYFAVDGATDPMIGELMTRLARYAVNDDTYYDRPGRRSDARRMNQEDKRTFWQEVKYRYRDGKMQLWEVMEQEGLILQILSLLIRDRLVTREEEMPIKLEKNLERLKGVLEYVEEHYAEPISTAEIAKRFYFSRTYFSKFFHDNMAVTFKEYLNTYRTQKARLDLLETSKSIYEVALDNGFADSRRFIISFSGYYGMTPLQYRKHYAKK